MNSLVNLFEQYPGLAILISLIASIVIAILGVIPSVFITAANIIFFGFIQGTVISFTGEALGAWISFLLYRKGFQKMTKNKISAYPKLKKLIDSEGSQAFFMIFSLRLLPFVPSGLITFAAAIGKVSTGMFVIASSLGKIPALLLEAYSVYQVAIFGWQGKLILVIAAIAIIVFVIYNNRQR